jgi:hypothetical protein
MCGFPSLCSQVAADYVWQTTAEGDFLVMLLQTARFLMKCFDDVRKGEVCVRPDAVCAFKHSCTDRNRRPPPLASVFRCSLLACSCAAALALLLPCAPVCMCMCICVGTEL